MKLYTWHDPICLKKISSHMVEQHAQILCQNGNYILDKVKLDIR